MKPGFLATPGFSVFGCRSIMYTSVPTRRVGERRFQIPRSRVGLMREIAEVAMKKEWTPEERAAIEAKYKAEFTAADLQKYTEEDDVVPLEDLIKELKEKQRGKGV